MISIVRIGKYYFVKPESQEAMRVFPNMEGKDASCYRANMFVLFMIVCRCGLNNLKYRIA